MKISTVAAVLLLPLAACDRDADGPVQTDEPVAMVAADGDWIRIDGTVASAAGSQFVLDYGEDAITVEVDDWDSFAEGAALLPGDWVSVTGRVDENLFRANTIEASAVYLHNLNTVYFANAADEEEFDVAAVPSADRSEGIEYTGWVTGKSDQAFTLGADALTIKVETSGLQTPYAKTGVDVGDRVYVWGDLDLDPEGGTTLVAAGLVELRDAATAAQSAGSTSNGK